MSISKDGWFSEKEVLWPGQRFGLKVEEVLYEGRSAFQDVLVFRSSTYGVVLVLDGVIMLTERDEHAYQEMMAHIPLYSHPNPRSVLIVGGGDGGVLREVCRHSCVERIDMCEIDEEVCNVSKKYMPNTLATSFDDPRLTLVHEDAAEYVKDKTAYYDVVIVDSTDPVGPAATLFTSAFYASLSASMRPGAICANQGECIWLHLDLIDEMMGHCTKVFSSVDYAYTTVPSYPSGQIGMFVCCTQPNKVLRRPARKPTPEEQAALKYYSTEVHAASFVVPRFAEQVVAKHRAPTLEAASTAASAFAASSLTRLALGAALGAAAAVAAIRARR